METATNPAGSTDRANRLTNDQAACAYVVVIPTTEEPVIEALQKLIAALSSREPFVLSMGPRNMPLEIADSWLE
ncbi:MAG: hypothetical protein WBQ31_02650, partial [Candidatus Acidiferrales bacterium]